MEVPASHFATADHLVYPDVRVSKLITSTGGFVVTNKQNILNVIRSCTVSVY